MTQVLRTLVTITSNAHKILSLSFLCTLILLSSCTPVPPDNRAPVTAPIYTGGNAENGKALYEEYCSQCHQLQPGKNKKGPQLIGVYEAPSASLADYKYSSDISSAHVTWDAETLDTYIADPVAMMADTRMLSDPIPEANIRQDIIAYLSTLGRADQVIPSQE